MSLKDTKAYLGDAVYVAFDGCGLMLTTEDGLRATNRIYLEPEVYAALVEYVKRLRPKDWHCDTCGCGGTAGTEDMHKDCPGSTRQVEAR